MSDHTTSTRRRLLRGTGLGAGLTVALASAVWAATTQVEVSDNKVFNAPSVKQTPGGRVHWLASGVDAHSVTSDQLLFDTGQPRAGVDFTRTFSAGTFRYHCRKHGDQGMVGVVSVAPRVAAAPAGLPFTVTWATAASNTGNRYDVQYRVGTGRFKTWLGGSSARSAVFGARSRPVRLVRGKTYTFKVRSRAGTGASAYSPLRTFRVR